MNPEGKNTEDPFAAKLPALATTRPVAAIWTGSC